MASGHTKKDHWNITTNAEQTHNIDKTVICGEVVGQVDCVIDQVEEVHSIAISNFLKH